MGSKRKHLGERIMREQGYVGHTETDRASGTTKFSRELIDAIDFGPSTQRHFHIDNILAKLHPEDSPWVKVAIGQPVGPSGIGEFVFRGFDRRGKTRWLQYRFAAHKPQQLTADPTQVTGVMFDVTSRIEEGSTFLNAAKISRHGALHHLADGLLMAVRAAQLIGLTELEHSLHPALREAGRLLARFDEQEGPMH